MKFKNEKEKKLWTGVFTAWSSKAETMCPSEFADEAVKQYRLRCEGFPQAKEAGRKMAEVIMKPEPLCPSVATIQGPVTIVPGQPEEPKKPWTPEPGDVIRNLKTQAVIIAGEFNSMILKKDRYCGDARSVESGEWAKHDYSHLGHMDDMLLFTKEALAEALMSVKCASTDGTTGKGSVCSVRLYDSFRDEDRTERTNELVDYFSGFSLLKGEG